MIATFLNIQRGCDIDNSRVLDSDSLLELIYNRSFEVWLLLFSDNTRIKQGHVGLQASLNGDFTQAISHLVLLQTPLPALFSDGLLSHF